ncbi:MAG: hypothetical protein IPJ77_04870 [Planctomycetes bacterium]|nr:hypothetical protein [Planctomycetota bacterium]
MRSSSLLLSIAVLAATASAQAPNFYQFPNGSSPMDATTAGGVTLVAGVDGSGAFL